MYDYSPFDAQFVRERAAQYRHQLERHTAGALSDEEFRPLRLQNGWYLQRHAPMLRVAVPYGVISSAQLRGIAAIAREFDRGYAHLSTRQNIQFNWIALKDSADVMDRLAALAMHGIQTSGNCVRNITTDARAGIAPDEAADPRPFCELLRQWSTLHPEFAHLPRKFKIAVSASAQDRAKILWHDVGLKLVKNAAGSLGFEVYAGGGMGRTPVIAPLVRAFVPYAQILQYLEAILRVYNLHGRRDNAYKARIKILVKALGQRFTDDVEAEFERISARGENLISPKALQAMSAHFDDSAAYLKRPAYATQFAALDAANPGFPRWRARNVLAHAKPHFAAVMLSTKRAGVAPGDLSADQFDAAAALADEFSASEMRITHTQNLLLPHVREQDLFELWQRARALNLASPTIGLVTDMICCPGGDFCSLANAKSLPVADAIFQRLEDIDYVEDLGELDLNISGCINSCGHHHAGHLGILGVDKDGSEWYQITLGGRGGALARAGKVIGPSFSADQVADVVSEILRTYTDLRQDGELFVDAVDRLGIAAFKARVYAPVAEAV